MDVAKVTDGVWPILFLYFLESPWLRSWAFLLCKCRVMVSFFLQIVWRDSFLHTFDWYFLLILKWTGRDSMLTLRDSIGSWIEYPYFVKVSIRVLLLFIFHTWSIHGFFGQSQIWSRTPCNLAGLFGNLYYSSVDGLYFLVSVYPVICPFKEKNNIVSMVYTDRDLECFFVWKYIKNIFFIFLKKLYYHIKTI